MRLLKNEKGVALAMILILSAIALAIIAGLLFIITSSTQISGIQKRYKTALEAGSGGVDATFQFIALRGVTIDTDALKQDLIDAAIPTVITTSNTCQGTNIEGTVFTGLAAKLNTPSSSWSAGCKDIVTSSPFYPSVLVTPTNLKSYDMTFELGFLPTYTVYAKIADTVEGNSGPDTGFLVKGGVVTSGGAEIQVVAKPYLYTVEVDSQNSVNPMERAKLSILYQY